MNCKTQTLKIFIHLGFEFSVHLAFQKNHFFLDRPVYTSCGHANILEGQ